MLNEHQAAAVGFFFPPNNPANDPQHQPPFVQAHPVMIAGPPHPFSYSQAFPPSQPFFGSAPTLQAITQPPKRRCSVRGCKRVPADECGLCKTCCGQRGNGCTNRKHLATPPQTIRATSFTPTRPPAVLPPLQLTPSAPSTAAASSSSAVPALEPTPRLFRDEMPEKWVKEWNDRDREVRQRREAAELRRKNELAMARQVVVHLWRQVRAPF
jgi:hypothetical protein